eukprot:gene8604-9532_t
MQEMWTESEDTIVTRLSRKVRYIVKEKYLDLSVAETHARLKTIRKAMEDKQKFLKALDTEIIDNSPTEDLEKEIEENSDWEMKVTESLENIDEYKKGIHSYSSHPTSQAPETYSGEEEAAPSPTRFGLKTSVNPFSPAPVNHLATELERSHPPPSRFSTSSSPQQGQHFSYKCQNVSELKARNDILSKAQLCFKCLRTGHKVRNQVRSSERNCLHCQGKHHQAICDKKHAESRPVLTTTNDPDSEAITTIIRHANLSEKSSEVTATAQRMDFVDRFPHHFWVVSIFIYRVPIVVFNSLSQFTGDLVS